MRLLIIGALGWMLISGCGDDTPETSSDVAADVTLEDAAATDTHVPDAQTEDTALEDIQEDTSAPDTALEDSALPDTAPDDVAADANLEDTSPEDVGEEDVSTGDVGEQPLDIVPTQADETYLDYWVGQDHGENFVSGLKWLPHFIHEQGELGICLRLEFKTPQTVDGELIESIRSTIEERVWQWQKGLIGEPNWIHNTKIPLYLFGIGVTPAVELVNPPNVPIYTNDAAECPNTCFRFTYKHDEDPQYEDCDHPTMSHFDFNIWYSDFPFGAAGHGGDWGTRLVWDLFLDELSGQYLPVTDHELGHVAGLPDVYNYPVELNGDKVPKSLMVFAPTIQDFDYIMLRKVWEWAWEAYYAP